MSERIPMTRAGYDKLKADLAQLHDVELPKILERLATARGEGDLSENAEYHGAQESRGMMEARINVLREKLSHAVLIDTALLPKDEVTFGSTVVVNDLDFGDQEEFTLVGAGEEDYDSGKILVTSPLAQGLLGKKVGQRVEIPVPQGTLKFEIVENSPAGGITVTVRQESRKPYVRHSVPDGQRGARCQARAPCPTRLKKLIGRGYAALGEGITYGRPEGGPEIRRRLLLLRPSDCSDTSC